MSVSPHYPNSYFGGKLEGQLICRNSNFDIVEERSANNLIIGGHAIHYQEIHHHYCHVLLITNCYAQNYVTL